MSSRAIIWTVVVIIIVVVGGWYLLSNGTLGSMSSGSDMATTTAATSTADTTTTTTQSTTLKALTAQGGNYTCTIDTITSNGETTGTVEGAGGKTRLDLEVAQNGVNTTMHIIRNGTTSYTWVDGQQTGTEAAITPTTPVTPAQGGVISVSDTSNVSSTCHPWLPDATQFVPPAGITFSAQ